MSANNTRRFLDPDTRRLLEARIAFAHNPAVNIGIADRCREMGFDPLRILNADPDVLASSMGLRPKAVKALRSEEAMAVAAREVDFIEDNGVAPLWFSDPDFPTLLRECADIPAMLYLLGTPPRPEQRKISIVGTRHCTPYGRSFIESLVRDLAESVSDLLVVSGLALGADIAAHRAAIKAGVPTGAVMAEGLNRVYPAEHRSDAVRILREGGFMLTSYLSSDPTHKGNFLSRNRLVAGISEVTVIVESDLRGGAMSTARLACAYQREVLALPGRVTDQYSRGCNELIANHTARIVRDAGDVLEATGWTADRKPGVQTVLLPELSDSQQALLDLIRSRPDATVNDLAVAVNLPFAHVSSILFEMELNGFITAIAGGRYIPAI